MRVIEIWRQYPGGYRVNLNGHKLSNRLFRTRLGAIWFSKRYMKGKVKSPTRLVYRKDLDA